MSVICPLVHLSRSRLIIAIVNHRCLLKQCPGQLTAHIGTQATAATRKKQTWQRAMRKWSLPSLPPLLVSSISSGYLSRLTHDPAQPAQQRWFPWSQAPGLMMNHISLHHPLHRSSAWLVNSNNFLHLDQSQILGLATPHLWSQYPVPGTHHPLVWLHRPGVAVTHITRLTTTEIWYWIDTIKFLAAIESFFVQFYCRFVFSLSANKHRDQTHTAADWQKETGESSIDNGWFDGWVVVFAGHHSHN